MDVALRACKSLFTRLLPFYLSSV